MGKRDAEDDEFAFPRGGGEGGDLPRGARSDRSHDREKTGKRRKTGGAFDDDSMPFGHARVASASKEKHFVESLKYKTLRVGMKLLGVVTEVTERGMQVSLPNGLKGTVTRAEAADAFADERARDEKKAEAEKKKKKKTKTKTKDRRGSEETNGEQDDDDDDASESSEFSASESESDSADDWAGGDPPLCLTEAFHVGQIVRCAVRRLDKGKSGGKRIDLTTRVSALLRDVAAEAHLRDGVNVPAEVVSAEDHGFVLSFGVADAPPGFLPRKAAPQGRALVAGSTLDVVLTGADRADGRPGEDGSSRPKPAGAKRRRGALAATADRKRVASAVTHESDATSVSTLLPGMLVNARIKAVLADGVSANFMTYFVGTVDAFHVGDAARPKGRVDAPKGRVNGPAIDPAQTHRVGERCRARVLFVDAATKRVGLSLRPHLIHYGAPRANEAPAEGPEGAAGGSDRAPDAAAVVLGPGSGLPRLGFVCEAATVRRVDRDVGLLLELDDGSGARTLGYCHISDASDGRVEKLEKAFKVNATARCRVVGRRAADGVSVVSCRRSVIEQPFLSADELEPGMRVRGEVVALEPYGAVVRLAPGVKALCPPHHVSDVPGRVSSAKVKEGATLQFRVLAVDKRRRRVSVTHKKTLVRSDLAVVADARTAAVGARCHGVVTGVEPYGVFVQLFGEARGLAGLQDLGLSVDQTPEEAYQPGQCVRCAVLRADDPKKLRLSLVDTNDFGGPEARAAAREPGGGERTGDDDDDDAFADDVPAVGTVFPTATVTSVDLESSTVRVSTPHGAAGAITAAHVSDHPETGAALVSALRKGDEIGPVVVLESKPGTRGSSRRGRCVLSRKRSLVSFASRGALPESVADVAVGASYPGYVASVAGGGVFVRFLGRLTGLCPPSGFQTCFSGTSIDPSDRFALGQTVVARVTAVDATTSPPRVSLTLAGAGVSGRERGGENVAENVAAFDADADPDAALVRAVFDDAETLDALAEKRGSEVANGEYDGVALSLEAARTRFAPGSRISVTATAIKPYGVLAETAEDDDAVCLLANAQTPRGGNPKPAEPGETGETEIEEGDALDVVVLDVDRREGVVDVSARRGLLSGGKGPAAKRRRTPSSPSLGAEVAATIELVKPEYVVVSLPDFGDAIAYCATRSFNAGFGPGVDETRRGEDGEPAAPLGGKTVGERFAARVVATSPGGRLLLCADAASLGDASASVRDGDTTLCHAVGASFEAVVREVQLAQLILDLPGGGRGRLHATEAARFGTELSDGSGASRSRKERGSSRVFGSVARGDAMRVVVLGPAGDRGSMLELSARRAPAEAKALFAAAADAGASDGGGAGVCGAALLSTHAHGDVIRHGVVSAVSCETLAVTVAPGVTVRIPRIETASDAKTLAVPLATRFAAGEACGALVVLTSDAARRKMTCTLRSLENRAVAKGARLPAIVVKVASAKDGGSVFAQLTGTRRGRAHACDLADGVAEAPWRKFKPGDAARATVLSVSEDGGEIDLSFKTSSSSDGARGAPDTSDVLASSQPGSAIHGYVKNVTKGGVFVAVARDADARIKMCNLGDAFVEDPVAAFPRGALVRGVVVAADAASRRVEMTLRSDGRDASDRGAGTSGNAPLAPLPVGLVTMGTVRRVQTYGVFVTLDGSGRSGLCHISAFADARIKDSLEAHVRAGERVRVKVLGVDEATGRVSLGMKPSLFEAEDEDAADGEATDDAGKKEDVLLDDAEEEDDEEDEEEDEEEEDEDEEDDEDDDHEEDDDEEDDDEENEEDEDDVGDGSDELLDDDASDAPSSSEEDEMDVDSEDAADDADSDSADDSDSAPEPMDDDDGLDWDADAKGRDRGGSGSDDEKDAGKDADEKPLTKREKARRRAAKELELHKKEQALKTRVDAAPETASEFEKALMGNPRSSFLWIRYVALHVSVGAHDEARAVAERALKAIPSSDQDEKMNLWVMYLNLEHAHGKPNPRDAVAKLFARACQVANPKKLHLALAGTYERGGDFEAQTALLSAATRKFSQSAKVWIAHARAVILAKARNAKGAESVDPDAVKKALDRASQSLPQRKVVKVLVQVALVEIREGSRERGRSVFESVLRNYPRRTDIWSTYVDQEIKLFAESGDPERCRGLLERATHLELNPKSMKFLFKRYLDFERRVGDAKRVEHVKERAMQYVASKFG